LHDEVIILVAQCLTSKGMLHLLLESDDTACMWTCGLSKILACDYPGHFE